MPGRGSQVRCVRRRRGTARTSWWLSPASNPWQREGRAVLAKARPGLRCPHMNEVPMSMHDHRQRHRRWLAGLLVAVAVAAAAGCAARPAGSAQTGPDAPDVVFAAVPATGAAALYIAQDRGLFAKAGVRVRIDSSVSAAAVLPALVHGSVDVSL